MPAMPAAVSRFAAHYGTLGVLLVLCVICSVVTYQRQEPVGEAAARQLAGRLADVLGPQSRVVIVARGHEKDLEFADALATRLEDRGVAVLQQVCGEPAAVRAALEHLANQGARIDLIAAPQSLLLTLTRAQKDLPALSETRIAAPEDYWWPTFLLKDNLLAVANRIVVIAVIAVGMTMVIITGGIDLSVGSLVALSAVLTAKGIVLLGGERASAAAMIGCSLGGIAICAGVGAFSGLMVTLCRVPPFIATLAMMQVARGLALLITRSQSIPGLPRSFAWLGLKADLLGIPNALVLMLLIYALAIFVMGRSRLGRHIYAVGGNRQAARLSGIGVRGVLLTVYVICGAMAGLGGVIEASQFTSGDPKSGAMYELDVIAAEVVGGTSLSGGEGRIYGTLLGALMIAVIQNGMNLINVESNAQRVVLGLVLLGAVLLDMLRKGP